MPAPDAGALVVSLYSLSGSAGDLGRWLSQSETDRLMNATGLKQKQKILYREDVTENK